MPRSESSSGCRLTARISCCRPVTSSLVAHVRRHIHHLRSHRRFRYRVSYSFVYPDEARQRFSLRQAALHPTAELALYRQHTERAEHLLMALEDMQPLLPIIRSHHERFNGEGFRGNQAPELDGACQQQVEHQRDEREFDEVFTRFKQLADSKKELFDGDIEALVLRASSTAHGPWTLESLDVEARSGEPARARVLLRHTDGRTEIGRAHV